MFKDRKEAGHKLADTLAKYTDKKDIIVIALPRGGIVIGTEIAKSIDAPLNVIITLDKLVDDYFLKYRYNSYPVVSNGILLGIVSIHDVKEIPREDWNKINVSKILDSKRIKLYVSPDEDATSAMSKMVRDGIGRVPVLDNGKVVGIVSRKDIMQILKHKTDLRV